VNEQLSHALVRARVRVASAKPTAWAAATLKGELPFVHVGYRERPKLVGLDSSLIPRIVWSTWIDDRLGRTHAAQIGAFRALNPEFDFRLIDDSGCREFVATRFGGHPIAAVFERARFGPMRSDIWRYLVLLEYGGWYFDIKSRLKVPLREVTPDSAEAVIAYEPSALDDANGAPHPSVAHPGQRVANWAIAFKPGHPFLERLIEAITEAAVAANGRVFAHPKSAILATTGPEMLGRVLHRYADETGLEGFYQCGIGFGQAGVYEMRSSWVRFLRLPSYAGVHDAPLFL
jgi:mannosyltransferase OCH1-like enzyme